MIVQASAPGKLFLAGEYAVVESGHKALIAAIDQYITVTVALADRGGVYSSQQKEWNFWHRQEGAIVLESPSRYSLIAAAMKVVEKYARIQGRRTDSLYQVKITSALDDPKGRKYGLGSSGAVTVATIRAILAFYDLDSAAPLVFRLAALAQMAEGISGSFGDLAASSYGGVVLYQSVDRQWLQQMLETESFERLLSLPWKGLAVEQMELPKELSLMIGWTETVSSTQEILVKVELSLNKNKPLYLEFLQKSQHCVTQLQQACQTNQADLFRKQIMANRALLKNLEEMMDFKIETPNLQRLIHIAEAQGAVAKTSGAGGGDCGIVFVQNKNQLTRIEEEWKKVGIVPLPFSIAATTEE